MQNAEEVSAAIQEAIKGIPYPVDEVVTVDHDFGYMGEDDIVEGTENPITEEVNFDEFSAEYYLSGIEFGKAKKFDISASISGQFVSGFGNRYYCGGIFLPEGGTYIELKSNGGFKFHPGGTRILSVYCKISALGSMSAEASTSLYLARIA